MVPSATLDTISDTLESATSWDVFDRIYCITLATRPDRRQSAAAEFRRVGLERVEFITVDRHPTNSEQGIYESHQLCLRRGLESGARTMLLFEDDVRFVNTQPRDLRNVSDFLETSGEWDIFFLGCFVNSSRKTSYPSILKIRYKCCAHAYAVTRAIAGKILESPFRGIAFDDYLRGVPNLRAFTRYPAIASQSDSASDNGNTKSVDRARRVLGGVRNLQRLNEFTHRRMTVIIGLHVLVIVLLSSLWLWHRFA